MTLDEFETAQAAEDEWEGYTINPRYLKDDDEIRSLYIRDPDTGRLEKVIVQDDGHLLYTKDYVD